jgi:hypothetical protein
MRKILAVVIVVGTCSGCGRTYHLPGHNEHNLKAPPDLTMRVGDRRKAITTGLTVKDMLHARASLTSASPDVVRVEVPSRGTANVVAGSVGSARLRYYPRMDRPDPDNQGFLVTVLPAR